MNNPLPASPHARGQLSSIKLPVDSFYYILLARRTFRTLVFLQWSNHPTMDDSFFLHVCSPSHQPLAACCTSPISMESSAVLVPSSSVPSRFSRLSRVCVNMVQILSSPCGNCFFPCWKPSSHTIHTNLRVLVVTNARSPPPPYYSFLTFLVYSKCSNDIGDHGVQYLLQNSESDKCRAMKNVVKNYQSYSWYFMAKSNFRTDILRQVIDFKMKYWVCIIFYNFVKFSFDVVTLVKNISIYGNDTTWKYSILKCIFISTILILTILPFLRKLRDNLEIFIVCL